MGLRFVGSCRDGLCTWYSEHTLQSQVREAHLRGSCLSWGEKGDPGVLLSRRHRMFFLRNSLRTL